MSRVIFFYLKSTSETPIRFKKEFISQNSDKSQIFKAVTTFNPYCVVFNNDNQSKPWSVRNTFNYIQLYWSIGNFVNGKDNMKLISGKHVIIIRLVIKGLFQSIIRLIIFLTRVRNKIRKKRLYFLAIVSNNNHSSLSIFSGHDVVKEQIYEHAFKKKKLDT